jgi:hypothetical protein
MKPNQASHKPIRAGLYERLGDANRAVDRLREEGYPASSIIVVCPEALQGEFEPVEEVDPDSASDPAVVGIGSAIGGALGAAAMAVGVVASGGTGLLVIGPLFGGALAGGVAGGLVSAMVARGFEPGVADFYDQALGEGQIMVAVEESPDAESPSLERASKILRETGARVVPLKKG